MTNLNWITLNDFSTKYSISLSTLRRRIRAGQVEHQFRSGKYWLRDQPVSKHINSYMSQEEPEMGVMSLEKSQNFAPPKETENPKAISDKSAAPAALSALPTMALPNTEFIEPENKVIQELKGAYKTVLHEKEATIMQLKAEISNLKTLIQILESENDRLTSNLKESSPIDGWIQENFE